MNEQNAKLKQTLGFWDLMSAAVGQIIGAGIMSLTGVAIAMTGRSVPIAFVLSAVMVLITNLPLALINTIARYQGGIYSIIGSSLNKKFTGMYSLLFILSNLSLSMYTLSFADYAMPFLPMVPRRALAIGLLVVIYLLNYRGIDKFSQFQNIIVASLVVALATFSFYGVTQMDFSTYYDAETFMTDGVLGLLTATAQLTFATGGANVIANLSAEAKNPTKDIPKVMIVATITVAVLYAFMASIAAGILPVEQVANQPLTLVAERVLPRGLYVFFIIGGAWFALISTLNSQLATCTKPLLQAAKDGWLPEALSFIHPKFKTPTRLLTFFFVVGLIPVVLGLDISFISKTVTFVGTVINSMVVIAFYKATQKFKENWERSPLYLKEGPKNMLVVTAIAIYLLQAFLMGRSLPLFYVIGNIVVFILAYLFATTRYSSGNVQVTESYTLNE